MISLRGCIGNLFSCNDGSCIEMDKRCDGKLDCSDRSDEEECTSLVSFEGYHSDLVPPPKVNNKDSRLNLTFSVSIAEILEINEFEGFLSLKMTFIRSWFNSHLTYLNLKKDTRKNVLSSAEVSHMWRPWTIFHNLETVEDVMKTDFPDVTMIEANKNYTYKHDDRTNRRLTRLFDGSENMIIFTRERYLKFICNYDLQYYPFDKQTCGLEMYSANWNSILLRPGSVEYLGPSDLQSHHIYNVFLCTVTDASNGRKDVIMLGIIMGRPLFSNILTVFLPTLILLVLSQMARMFYKNHMEMVIEINLTLLLVLATL